MKGEKETKGVKMKGQKSVPQVTAGPKTSGAGGLQAVYRQIDKLEFYIPDASIETADKPQNCYVVAVPITDSNQGLRYEKINSVRVHLWNRGANDLYLEVLQPFGAHNSPETIVAWAPVRGRQRKPQAKWTIKANKSGGFFRLDVTDNSLTLPALQTIEVTNNGTKTSYLYLVCFAFSVIRNASSFTGTEGGKSSRALAFKILVDFVGPKTDTPQASIAKAGIAEMGKVEKYPIKTVENIYRDLGMIPVSKIIRAESIYPDLIPIKAQLAYTQQGGKVDQIRAHLCFCWMQGLHELDDYAEKAGLLDFPVYPVPGIVIRPAVPTFTTGNGYGNVLVRSERLELPPDFELPEDKQGWYVASAQYVGTRLKYFPLLVIDAGNVAPQEHCYAGPQFTHGKTDVRFSEMVPYHDSLYDGMIRFRSSMQVRYEQRYFMRSDTIGVDDAEHLQFPFTAFINMVTVIIKVVEAAYAAYQQYAPTNLKTIFDTPLHLEYVEEGFHMVTREIE